MAIPPVSLAMPIPPPTHPHSQQSQAIQMQMQMQMLMHQRIQSLPPMPPHEWSRCVSEIFLTQYEPARALLLWRHCIPSFVLRNFCATERLKSVPWYGDEQTDEADALIIYDPSTKRFDRRHWSECYGDINIYEHYFDNLKQQQYTRHGFKTFEILMRIDHDIFSGLTEQTEAIWQIYEDFPRGEIKLRRGDLYYLRKLLFLMTSVRNRDRNQHLMARDPAMQDARNRRKKFMEAFSLDHPRDLWLRNTELILNDKHFDVATNPEIFDLDREDYRANARERFVVFWEAGPGEEFVLTDNAFGCFEGGQLGGRKKSNVSLTSREHEQRIYTRDYMWHQLYVLSPKLVLALCHGTLVHPELVKQQKKRWGLRRSLLEALPHPIDLANHHYKDLTRGEVSFLGGGGWVVPSEVEKLFGQSRWDGKVIAIENRENDELVFPVARLLPEQVCQVNTVLLQNQYTTQPVQSVSFKPPTSYRSLHDSLVAFRDMDWSKYTEVKQNAYDSLERRLATYLSRTDEVLSNGTIAALRPSPTVLSPQSGSPAPDNRKPVAEKKKGGLPTTPPEPEATKVDMVGAGHEKKGRRYSVSPANGAEPSQRRERSNPPPAHIPVAASQRVSAPPIPEQRRALSNERAQIPKRAQSKDRSVEPPSRRTALSPGQATPIQQQHVSAPNPLQPTLPQVQSQQQPVPQRRGLSSDRRFSVHVVEQPIRSEPAVPTPDHRVSMERLRAELKPSPEPRIQQAPVMEPQTSKNSAVSQDQRRTERSISASRRRSVASHQDHLPARVELQPSPIPHPHQTPQSPQQQAPIQLNASGKRPLATERRHTEQLAVPAPRPENAQPVLDSKRPGLADKRYYSSPGTILQPTMPQAASVPVPEPRVRRAAESTGQAKQTVSTAASAPAPKPVLAPAQPSALKNPTPAPKPAQVPPPTSTGPKPTQTSSQPHTIPASHGPSLKVDIEPKKVSSEQAARVTLEQGPRRLLDERVVEQRALEQQVSMNGYNRSRGGSASVYLTDDNFDKHDRASEVSSKSSSSGYSGSSGSSGSRTDPASGPGSESRALERIPECERDISPKRPVQPVVHISSKPQPTPQMYPTASHAQSHGRVRSLRYDHCCGVNDAEVEGSMIVEVDDEEEEWVDEGYAEVEECPRPPRRPIVRFASPKPSPTLRKASIGLNHRPRHPQAGPSRP